MCLCEGKARGARCLSPFADAAPTRTDPPPPQLNDRLSLGLHRVWKRMAVKWASPPPGGAALDVACGTGDVARLLAVRVGPGGTVVGLDFAPDMLAAAEAVTRDAHASSYAAPIQWIVGDAASLPFDDASFDSLTIAYGLRNVASPDAALAEAHRVLAPGGRCVVLDFNNAAASNPIADALQTAALSTFVVPAARAAGLGPEYEYLRPSIQAWWTGGEQEAAARKAGFASAVYHELALGLMGCLVAGKAGRR